MRGFGMMIGFILKWTIIATLIRGTVAFGGDLRRSQKTKHKNTQDDAEARD